MFGRGAFHAPFGGATPPSFGGTGMIAWSASDGSGSCPSSNVYWRASGPAAAIADWDGTNYRLDLYYRSASTSPGCSAAAYTLWVSDVVVDGSDGSWGGVAGNGYEETTVDVGAYEAVAGAQTIHYGAQAKIVRRSDSAVMDTVTVACTKITYDYCGGGA